MELNWKSQNPPWDTGLWEDAESKQDRVQRLSHPWLMFINLWNRGKIKVAGVFEWSDSRLIRSPHRYLDIGEPIWQDHYEYNDDQDKEEWVSETPRRSLIIQDETRFVKFLKRLDDGLQRIGSEAHRADIAMRYFRRVGDNFWAHHIGGDGSNQDHNEDIIVDTVTILESILSANEKRGKGAVLAARAAAVLEAADDGKRRLRKRIERLYKYRSAILHGDTRPSMATLTEAALVAEELARRCIAAFLLTNGDRQAMLRSSTDASVSEAIRQRIMF